MKLTIERASLVSTLAHVQNVVERRTTIPILANVRLDGEEGGLRVTATDMDIAVVERAVAEVTGAGSATASAHLLYDIVRKLPEGAQVQLATGEDGAHVTVTAAHARFSLPSLPVDEFPVMSEGAFSHEFALPAASLRRLIDKTRFAMSTEETRYYLNGIYLHAVDGEEGPVLRAVATDGHRLSRIDAPLADGLAGIPGVIVPRKTVVELRKLIDETAEEVRVSLSEGKVRFAFDDVVLTSKLIDGVFPDYERVIPSGNDRVLEVDGKTFARAVDRVSTIATDKTRSVKMALKRDRVVLSAHSADSGSADEEIEASYQAPDLEIGFNSRYLLDVADQIDGETMRFAMADAVSPTTVRDSGDSASLYVLMPMRV